MKTVCEILTTDLEGGAARIPFSLFKELFTYLAEIDGEIPKEHVDTVIEHLSYDVWVISKHTWLHFLACIASIPAQAKSKTYFLDIRLKSYRLPHFNMFSQFLLTKLFKSELFSRF